MAKTRKISETRVERFVNAQGNILLYSSGECYVLREEEASSSCKAYEY